MKTKLTQDEAEQIAFQVLTYIVQQPELIAEFLAETGIGPHELKSQLKEPAFLGALLDFLLSRPEHLNKFTEARDLNPSDILQARLHFPGAQQDTWVSGR